MTLSSNDGDKQQRRRRDRRAKQPRRMNLTQRVIAICEALHEYRILNQDQIRRLLGVKPSSKSAVGYSLRQMYDHHLVNRHFVAVKPGEGGAPTLYVLDKGGIDLLKKQGIYDFDNVINTSRLSDEFLSHTLATNEVRITFTQACAALGWQLSWQDEFCLKRDYDRVKVRGGKRSRAVIHDGYFVITIPDRGTAHFALELDRNTEAPKRYADKIEAFVTYYRSGGYKRRFGAERVRVLTVVSGDYPQRDGLRCDRLVALVPDRETDWFYFTTLAELTPETVLSAPVWSVKGANDPRPLFRL